MKHAIGAALLVIGLAALVWVGLSTDFLLPAQASEQAKPIDALFSVHFKLAAILFGLIVGVMLYSVIFFRRKKGDESDGPHITGSTPLEITWTAIPFILVTVLSILGAQVLSDTMRIDPQAVEIKVTGRQWSWRFEYPAYGFTSTELYLPLERQVIFKLTSEDVIHAFWVPEFRLKQDAVPGQITELRLTPSMEGQFQLICAEVCGRSHAYMTAVVKVVPENEFKTWAASGGKVAGQPVSDDPVVRGENVYKSYGCASCHSVDGSRLVGPSFQGLFGRQTELEDGSTVTADETYILESIHEPGKKIVKTYPNAMPPTAGEGIDDQQLQDLLAFIKSLK